jgi:hypothetical protein
VRNETIFIQMKQKLIFVFVVFLFLYISSFFVDTEALRVLFADELETIQIQNNEIIGEVSSEEIINQENDTKIDIAALEAEAIFTNEDVVKSKDENQEDVVSDDSVKEELEEVNDDNSEEVVKEEEKVEEIVNNEELEIKETIIENKQGEIEGQETENIINTEEFLDNKKDENQEDVVSDDSVKEELEEVNDDNSEEVVKEEEKVEEPVPNFYTDVIKKVKGFVLNAVIVQIERNKESQLWIIDTLTGNQEPVEEDISMSSDFPIGLKGGYVFWLSEDKHTLFSFNVDTKEYFQELIPIPNPEKGERMRASFAEIPWEVIIDSDNFYFYSERTGEVFSDEDSGVLESFRGKFELDKSLDTEELKQLNFSVEENIIEDQYE